MLRQESRLNPSVFRSLSEEEGGGGSCASKHNLQNRPELQGKRAALTSSDHSVQNRLELKDADFHVLQLEQN